MKTEHWQAAATLAAVALQKRVNANEDITEELMTSALQAAHRAILQVERDYLNRTPPTPTSQRPLR
ncbi:hypothetical protein Ga0061062_112135 [Comamonas thiooxydans]|nr:hypothetical protein Ga0061062_112135 [Comamonas thiooxydans]